MNPNNGITLTAISYMKMYSMSTLSGRIQSTDIIAWAGSPAVSCI